jgi:TIGR00255 family protein
MIQSMTGYGKATTELPNKKVTVEIKSLNSKQLDLSARMPNIYRANEMSLRNRLARELSRGKIDFSIFVESVGSVSSTVINQGVIESYHKQIADSAKLLNVEPPKDWFGVLLRMPDVLKHELQEADEEEWNMVMKCVEEAMANMLVFRNQEGEMLYNLFVEKINNIRTLLAEIEPYEEERIRTVKEKILESLKKIEDFDYDKNRFEQEMIYHIERLDINEEKSRLTNHLNYFIETMDKEVVQGKKLNFITQEIGREINTMGSKSNHAEMQKIVVHMKDELEQIKEQVLNVL